MIGSLLNLYCSSNPKFLNRLEIFSKVDKLRIQKKLKNEKDENNFFSTIAEIKFGELFHELKLEIKHEKKYSNSQTPDWSINLGNSTAICEVYRLGKSNKDLLLRNLQDKIIEGLKLEKLPYNYLIEINFLEIQLDSFILDITLICKRVKEWLKKSRKVGDCMNYDKSFKFEIKKTNTNVAHTCYFTSPKFIHQKHHKLKQEKHLSDNEITKKLKKYNEIISTQKLAFFICVDIDFLSGFDYDDFKKYFLGKTIEDIGFSIEEIDQSGSSWTELGEFYNNRN